MSRNTNLLIFEKGIIIHFKKRKKSQTLQSSRVIYGIRLEGCVYYKKENKKEKILIQRIFKQKNNVLKNIKCYFLHSK